MKFWIKKILVVQLNQFNVKMYTKSDACNDFNSFSANVGSSISDNVKFNGCQSKLGTTSMNLIFCAQ